MSTDIHESNSKFLQSSGRLLNISLFIQKTMKEGGYDEKVNETVNVVATKGTEIGQKTWGIMKGVMAMASQKVEQYAEGINWKEGGWPPKEGEINGHHQRSAEGNSSSQNSSQPNSTRQFSSSSSWDDWDNKERKETAGAKQESWGGWDDDKDDGYGSYSHSSTGKSSSKNRKSDSLWTEGGFL